MKRMLVLLLALLLTVSMILGMVACNDQPDDDPEDLSDDPATDDPGKTPDDDPAGERIALELPEKDFGGATYHILQWSANGQIEAGEGWIPWEEGHVEMEDGGLISDAVFARNAWVEETYGVEIMTEYVSVDGATSYATRMRSDASTSANEFQLSTLRTYDIVSLLQEGLYADMNEYSEYLHTNQPWWVADSVRSFALGDKLYVAATEMLLRDKGATAALFFNQTLAEDYTALPDFFELAREGAWTLEAMIEACETVYRSNDGDDLMNSSRDIWGVTGARDTTFFLFNSIGYKFAEIDADGYVEQRFGQDTDNVEHNSIVDLKAIYDDVMYAEWFFNGHYSASMEGAATIFQDGNALFDGNGMIKKTTENGMVNMTDLYGILPLPKLDEDQKDYSSLVWMHYDSTLGIPSHASDKEMCAIILEAMSWESYYTVYPTFYETVLLNRAAKEENSKEMLKLIFDTRSYDPGQYWKVGYALQEAILSLSGTGGSDISGLLASHTDAIEKELEKVNNWIDGKD